MSARTTPAVVNASGPLEPSPGNGPAVSSGMTVQSAVVPDAAADAVAPVPLLAPDPAERDAEPAGVALEPVGPQAARRPAL